MYFAHALSQIAVNHDPVSSPRQYLSSLSSRLKAWHDARYEVVLDKHVDNGGVGVPGLNEPLVRKPLGVLLAFLVRERAVDDGPEAVLHGQVYGMRSGMSSATTVWLTKCVKKSSWQIWYERKCTTLRRGSRA